MRCPRQAQDEGNCEKAKPPSIPALDARTAGAGLCDKGHPVVSSKHTVICNPAFTVELTKTNTIIHATVVLYGMSAMKRYEMAEYVMKTRAALKRLREKQRPGEQGGAGTKTDVLRAVREELSELLNEGYTVRQIAEALRNDVFGILPKTITLIVRESGQISTRKHTTKPGAKRRTSKAMESDAGKRADDATSLATQEKQTSPRLPVPGTFVIQNDSDDL